MYGTPWFQIDSSNLCSLLDRYLIALLLQLNAIDHIHYVKWGRMSGKASVLKL